MQHFTDGRGKTYLVKPTNRGAATQHGGSAPRNSVVAYFVYALADRTDENTPISREELVQSKEEERAFNYLLAQEAARLGYVELVER